MITQSICSRILGFALLLGSLSCQTFDSTRASAPIRCPLRVQYFTLLRAKNGGAAVGGRLCIGLYPNGTDTQAIAERLKSVAPKVRYQYPEWPVVQELKFRRQGNLNGLLKLYARGTSRISAKSLYSNMPYTTKYAREITKETLLFKAQYGPLVTIMTEARTPQYKFQPQWPYTLAHSEHKGWLLSGSPNGTLFGILLNYYPYWLPLRERGTFNPTKNYFSVVRRYSKKHPGPDVAVYVRRIRTFDPVIVKAVRRIVNAYQTGSDKDIVAIWRPKDRKTLATRLASQSDTSSEMRRPLASKKGFRAFPSIIGRDIAFVLLNPVGGGKIITLRLAKVGKKWYQSRQSDESTPVDWLPKYPPYEGYVLRHPEFSILIKSAGE